MASRTQIAAYVARELTANRTEAVRAAAAWLSDTGRTRQAQYLARDVAAELARQGYVLVRLTSARPLADTARANIERFVKDATGARELELETIIDPTVMGGVRIEIPGAELDATVERKLADFVQGVGTK